MYLGIDLGTSALKLITLAEDGAVLGRSEVPLRIASPAPGWREQDPADWWRALRHARAGLGPLGALLGIGLSGQMHSAVLLGAGGRILAPAILWNDGRATQEARELAETLPEMEARAGVRPLPGLTAPKLLWLARHQPDLIAKLRRVLLPKDWLGHRLHGSSVTDMSDAAGTLWLDQAARRWWPEAVTHAGIDPAVLPALAEATDVVGRVTPEAAHVLGLPEGVPVVAGGGDTAVAALAAGAVAPGRSLLSVGTSAQLLHVTAGYMPPRGVIHSFAHAAPNAWYQMAAMLNGAQPMAWFAGVVGATVPDLLSEAAAADPARVPVALPYLSGERSPHGDPAIRGAFYGLEAGTTRGEMMRAVVEAVAFTFADAHAALAAGGAQVTAPVAVGGGTRSDLLMQMVADLTGMEIARADSAELGAAVGAARLAAIGTGGMTLADLAPPPTGTVFTPRTAPALRDRLDRFRALYAALKPLR